MVKDLQINSHLSSCVHKRGFDGQNLVLLPYSKQLLVRLTKATTRGQY